MRLFEFEDPSAPKLMALSQFLAGRAKDTSAKPEISQEAFIGLARNLGVNVTPDNLAELIAQPPLSNVLEPFEPNSGVIRFKGNEERSTDMPVDLAQNIVDKNAKAATKRAMK